MKAVLLAVQCVCLPARATQPSAVERPKALQRRRRAPAIMRKAGEHTNLKGEGKSCKSCAASSAACDCTFTEQRCLLSAGELNVFLNCDAWSVMHGRTRVRYAIELGTIVIEPQTITPELLWEATNNIICLHSDYRWIPCVSHGGT
jgi:hypothetical protein